MKDANEWYLKNIYPDKKFLDAKKKKLSSSAKKKKEKNI